MEFVFQHEPVDPHGPDIGSGSRQLAKERHGELVFAQVHYRKFGGSTARDPGCRTHSTPIETVARDRVAIRDRRYVEHLIGRRRHVEQSSRWFHSDAPPWATSA